MQARREEAGISKRRRAQKGIVRVLFSPLGSFFLSNNWPLFSIREAVMERCTTRQKNRRFQRKRAGHLPEPAEKALSVNSFLIHQKFGRPEMVLARFLHSSFCKGRKSLD